SSPRPSLTALLLRLRLLLFLRCLFLFGGLLLLFGGFLLFLRGRLLGLRLRLGLGLRLRFRRFRLGRSRGLLRLFRPRRGFLGLRGGRFLVLDIPFVPVVGDDELL